MQRFYVTLIFCFSFLTSFNLPLNSQISSVASNSSMINLINQYREDRGALERFYHIEASPVHRKRMMKFYKEFHDQLENVDYYSLDVSGQVDFQLLLREIINQESQLEEEEELYQKLKLWINEGDPLYEYETLRRRGNQIQSEKLGGDLFQIRESYANHLQKLRKGEQVFSKKEILFLSRALEGQQEVLESLNKFYKGYDPEYDWWIKEPSKNLSKILDIYRKTFRKHADSSRMNIDDGSGISGIPAGKQELIRQLKRDMIPYSPGELIKIAENEFAWCDAELLKVSKAMGFGKDWRAAQEMVKESFVPPGQQPAMMFKLYKKTVDFLNHNEMVTIPPLAEETWRMNMLSARRQLVSPFFLGGESLLISYPTNEMDHDDKMMSMRGNNPHFARAVLHHEIIPGHHLQQFMNRRYQIHRNNLFGTPFWTEGWSLYWELLLYEKGFAKSPEDRIGMLFWRMHRCARIIFSLKYHLGEWTPQECIDFLVDRVGHEQANAEAEVRRSFSGGYPPLYQLAYMTGGLQFYKLKQELVDSGQMTLREYHDAVLHQNAMPVEMVRYILLDKNVPKEFETSWRFYDQ